MLEYGVQQNVKELFKDFYIFPHEFICLILNSKNR